MSGISNSMSEVISKITPPLEETISSAIKDNPDLNNLQEFQEVVGWIKESKTDTCNLEENFMSPIQNSPTMSEESSKIDSTLSELANKIVENLMQHIPSTFGHLLVDNIRIQTQGMEKSTKFDLSFTLDPIKPYVEFVKKINGIETLKIKALFQIDSDVKMADLGFLSNQNQKIIHLGNLLTHLKISLLQFSGFHNAIIVDKPRLLKEVEFKKDLSEIKLSL